MLLLEAGYSDANTQKNRKDGCVYKYPGYLADFFASGVFARRADQPHWRARAALSGTRRRAPSSRRHARASFSRSRRKTSANGTCKS